MTLATLGRWFLPVAGEADLVDFLVTLGSALLMYVFALHRGFGGALPFLRRAFPDRSDRFYVWADLVVVTVGGAFFGFGLYMPVDVPKAMAAGIGWIGALNVAMRKADPMSVQVPGAASGTGNG
jgi:hypothetical protein